ncbi:MAG TPA: hypothetical protein VJ837_00980 [Candidatus Paceibacterota bacterium]|nr:hypothetical protein [Candidatus Paceibacterota bacterium]
MSRKKEAPATCLQCGTKLPVSGRCVKWRRCEPFRKNNEALDQKIRALEAKK